MQTKLINAEVVAAPTLLIPFFPVTYYTYTTHLRTLSYIIFLFTPPSHLYPASHTESVRPYRPSFTSANPFCFFSTLFLFLFCIVLQYGRTGLLCLLCTFLRLWFRIFFSLDLKLIYLFSSIFSFVLGVLPTHRSSCVLSSRCDLRFG